MNSKTNKFIHKYSWLVLLGFCIIGLIYPIIGTIAIVCMLAPVVVSFFHGRMWCGNFCPRGSLNDNILSKFSYKKPIPKFFKSTVFKISFFIILMSFFIVQIVFAWGNLVSIGFVFVRMILITTTLAIVLGIFINPRTWCSFCPMGTMAHYVAKMKINRHRIKHVTFNKEKCVGCNICTKNCIIGIDVLKHKEQGKVLHADCLKCKICIEKCPKKALYM